MSATRITLGHKCMKLGHQFTAYIQNEPELAPALMKLRGYLKDVEDVCSNKQKLSDTELGRLSLDTETPEHEST